MRRFIFWWVLGLVCALSGAGLATITRLGVTAEYVVATTVLALIMAIATK